VRPAKDSLQSTYAATSAARSFRVTMAIAAEFDLEVDQYDVVGEARQCFASSLMVTKRKEDAQS